MKNERPRSMKRIGVGLVLGMCILALASAGWSSPARAHDRRGEFRVRDRSHGHHDRHRHRDHHRRSFRHHHRHFEIPVRIHARHLSRYDRYFWTRVYFPDHHHHHAIYRFPVYTDAGVFYRPYAYCGGRLLGGGHFAYHGRRVSFIVDF